MAKLTPETARNMNQGLGLVHRALALLGRIDESLLQLARQSQSRADNSIAEGVEAGNCTVGTGGISNNGWNGTNALDANSKRRGSYWKNTSPTQVITLGLGIRQPTPGAGIVLNPGETWDGRISGNLVWKGSVAPVASAAGATLAFIEV